MSHDKEGYCKHCSGMDNDEDLHTCEYSYDLNRLGICRSCMFLYGDPIEHVGLKPERTRIAKVEGVGYVNVEEHFFAEHWKKVCSRQLGRGAYLDTLLEDLGEVTQRDATVAATIIQWLGAGVGKCFLDDVERDIVKFRNEKALEADAEAVMKKACSQYVFIGG